MAEHPLHPPGLCIPLRLGVYYAERRIGWLTEGRWIEVIEKVRRKGCPHAGSVQRSPAAK